MTGYDSIAELFIALGRLEQRVEWLEAAKPEQKPALESSGNIVCLPGVTLATVRRRRSRKPDGGRS